MTNDRIETLAKIRYELACLLPELGEIVIAGGAVRDALMNRPFKDVDAFILSAGHGDSWRNLADNVHAKLSQFEKIKPVVEWHKSEPFLVDTILHDAGEIQVMLRNVKTVDELLDTFDWNVSLFALTASGIVQREDVANIKAGGELWVQRLTYPRSTLRRGFRFSERFHMKFREGEIEKVCAEVAKQHAERQARKDGGAGRAE